MTRDEYLAEVAALQGRQAQIWEDSLLKFLDMRRCGLGLCGRLDELDLCAKTNADAKQREDARVQAERERAEKQNAWQMAAREIEQIEITIAKLRERADRRL